MERQHSSGVIISGVRPGSPAQICGIKPGDLLLSVNGIPPRDTIDYSYLCSEERVRLKIRSGRRIRRADIHKGCDVNLGLYFEGDCFDGVRRCRNHCVFCFIDQLPPGLRPSLYEKDDDYRLSFLHGNFLTLTNCDDRDLQRILTFHLSPLYLSVHATDPLVRGFLLGQRGEAPVLDKIELLARGEISMHIQIVLCPGINDGDCLDQTIGDLAVYRPWVASVGLVPAGLTRFREGQPKLRAFTKGECFRLIERVEALQRWFRSRRGSSFVYLADEFYLRGQAHFPPGRWYDRYPQLENGIGGSRLFYDAFRGMDYLLPRPQAGTRRPSGRQADTRPGSASGCSDGRRLLIATGKAGAAVLAPVIRRLQRTSGLELRLAAIANSFFGPRITVTGLLTGQDLVRGLSRYEGEEVLLPDIVLRQHTSEEQGQLSPGGMTACLLDGMTLAEVSAQTGCRFRVIKPTAGALLEELYHGHICDRRKHQHHH